MDSFTSSFIDLEMLKADVSTKVLTQAHNKIGRAINSTSNSVSQYFIQSPDILILNSILSILKTILLVHSQAPASFLFISFYLSNSYILLKSFPISFLSVNSYLPPDFPLLSWFLSIGVFSTSFLLLDLQIDLFILSILASRFLASFLAVLPILGLLAGLLIVSGPYTFGTPDLGNFY